MSPSVIFRSRNLGLFSSILIIACSGQNPAANTSRTPPPGADRLPQVYVAWDSSSKDLALPWAPPSATDFEEGFGARVEVYSEAGLPNLENRLRDWNSRPYDFILVGPSRDLLPKIAALKLPRSDANGPRIFLSSGQSGTSPPADWALASLKEAPLLILLDKICKGAGATHQGCSFSAAALKKKSVEKLPKGSLRVQFSARKSEPAGNANADVALHIAWESVFREFRSRNFTAAKDLGFSDGFIKLDLSPKLPADLADVIKLASIELLGAQL